MTSRDLFLARESLEIVRVRPLLCTSDIVGDPLLQEGWLGTALESPVVPIPVQLVQVYKTSLAECEASNLPLGSACSWMIPRTDDQIVLLPCEGGPVMHVLFVKLQSSRLVCIILSGNGKDWNVDSSILLWGRNHRVPVSVRDWMLQPLLKDC